MAIARTIQIKSNSSDLLIPNTYSAKNLSLDFTYKVYSLSNFEKIPQIQEQCSPQDIHDIKVVGNVLPFKVNNYVIDQLINWDHPHGIHADPIYNLSFPHRGMLEDRYFESMEQALESDDKSLIKETADFIRHALNPQPAGQKTHNVPMVDGEPVDGAQHKYAETVLFFPNQGQTCHSYCTFCFRWPQFTGMEDQKFASKQINQLIAYLQTKPKVTDILFTGGDPMVMNAKTLRSYIEPIIEANLPNLKHIRFGSKSLSYWPYKFIQAYNTKDAESLLSMFGEIREAGMHAAFMAHFNHFQELQSEPLEMAVRNLHHQGVQIRTQSPLLKHINDDSRVWAEMWRQQVVLGMIPYYFFIVRDTGARHFYEIPLIEAWQIFTDAYRQVSGICRTVRGPSMSAMPGKVQVVGPATVAGEKVLVLQFIQGRYPEWVGIPFFAKYDAKATWLDRLKPAFGDKFFFEETSKEPINVEIPLFEHSQIQKLSNNFTSKFTADFKDK